MPGNKNSIAKKNISWNVKFALLPVNSRRWSFISRHITNVRMSMKNQWLLCIPFGKRIFAEYDNSFWFDFDKNRLYNFFCLLIVSCLFNDSIFFFNFVIYVYCCDFFYVQLNFPFIFLFSFFFQWILIKSTFIQS